MIICKQNTSPYEFQRLWQSTHFSKSLWRSSLEMVTISVSILRQALMGLPNRRCAFPAANKKLRSFSATKLNTFLIKSKHTFCVLIICLICKFTMISCLTNIRLSASTIGHQVSVNCCASRDLYFAYFDVHFMCPLVVGGLMWSLNQAQSVAFLEKDKKRLRAFSVCFDIIVMIYD